jgi:hypothetical protein
LGIHHQAVSVYLNYFSCLEDDLLTLSRWIEFCPQNEGVFSIELARLLMTACAEVDVVAKALCKEIAPERGARNIGAYQEVLCTALPMLGDVHVRMARFGMVFNPWLNWKQSDNPPLWWTANNKVKHHRSQHFAEANLRSVLNAIAGLLVLLVLLHSKDSVHFPMPKLFVPDIFATREGDGLRILIPDGNELPWAIT